MDKKNVISKIIEVCKEQDWNFTEKYKQDDWKADILIDYCSYKVAITIGKRFKSIPQTYADMRKERVCGCWISLPGGNFGYDADGLPCFYLKDDDEHSAIELKGTGNVEIKEFVQKLVTGKVVKSDSIKINRADIYPIGINCWKCGASHYVYFVKRLITEQGCVLNYHEDFDDSPTFAPELIESLQTFLSNHKELNIPIGEIKHRYSKTVDDNYLSFGCPKCDAIVGSFYLMEYEIDCIYDEDESHLLSIDTSSTNFLFPFSHWELKD